MCPILLAALAGCISNERALTLFDDDRDGAYTEYAEAYGGTAPWDCDDRDADVRSGGTEVCDGKDNDCDGTADDGVGVDLYVDSDGDGFGAGAATLGCAAGDGYSLTAGDCADGDAAISPDATEICGGGDENCDGATDEAGAAGETAWHLDADHDGHGDPAVTLTACDAPVDYVGSADDCDDTSDKAAPGLAEICNDGADNDCDGTAEPCRLTGAIDLATKAAQVVNGKYADDHLGIAAAIGDLNDDGVDDLAVAVAGLGGSDSGDVRVVFGGSGFNIVSAPQADLVGGPAMVGHPVDLCVSELTGDGVDDLVVGWARSKGADHPDYAIYSGPQLNGSVGSTSGAHITSTAVTAAPRVTCGAIRHAAGDILVANGAGAWFFAPLTSARSLTSPDATETAADYSAVDIDGDGWDDLWRHVGGGTTTSVYYGPVTSTATADLTLSGTVDFAQFVASGDVNGDGRPDLLATAPNDGSGKGAAHLWYGGTTRATGVLTAATATRHIMGPEPWSRLYWAAFAGDVDGDGVDDVVASASAPAAASSTGWVIYGSTLAAGDAVAGADVEFTIPGQNTPGFATAVAGDWNGDGRGDLLWLVPNAASNAGAGSAYLVFGRGM